MRKIVIAAWKRVTACFLAGVLAILPLVVTVAIVMWVANFLQTSVGPNTVVGRYLAKLGVDFLPNTFTPYIAGWILVLGGVFLLGVLVEFGAKAVLSRLADNLFSKIPLIGNIYSTSKQVVEMLDKKEDDALKGMSAVFCSFGQEGGAGVLAFQVSPERYCINSREYHVVIIPTAPVPFGGAMLFVPVESVTPAEMPVDGMMSIYLSMGVSAPQYLAKSKQD